MAINAKSRTRDTQWQNLSKQYYQKYPKIPHNLFCCWSAQSTNIFGIFKKISLGVRSPWTRWCTFKKCLAIKIKISYLLMDLLHPFLQIVSDWKIFMTGRKLKFVSYHRTILLLQYSQIFYEVSQPDFSYIFLFNIFKKYL